MKLYRYLAREVYTTTLSVVSILLLIFVSKQFVHYLGDAASGDLTAHAVMQLLVLQVPLLLCYLLPLSLFLGIVISYGKLFADSEMTVMLACGMSFSQLLKLTLKFSSYLIFVVAFISLLVQPKLNWYRDKILAQAVVASPIQRVMPNQFQSIPGSNWVFYVNSISRNRKHLHDIFIANEANPTVAQPKTKWMVIAAKSGYEKIDKSTGDEFLVLDNGSRYSGVKGVLKSQRIDFNEYGHRLKQNVAVVQRQAEFFSTGRLWKDRATNLNAAAELDWRLSMPISAFILVLLAVPMSQVKPRQGRYTKMIPGILLYVIYADLLFVGRDWIEQGSDPLHLGMWWVHLLMLLITAIAWVRVLGYKQLSDVVNLIKRKID